MSRCSRGHETRFNSEFRIPNSEFVGASARSLPRPARRLAPGGERAFTMIEIALCLAIIGFALVSILLVLPHGMNTQRETRETTIISQDASMLFEAIRGGARGLDDLTNYVYAITNYYAIYNSGQPPSFHVNGYSYTAATLNGVPANYYRLTNGAHIIGLLSTPEFVGNNGYPETGQPISSTFSTSPTFSYISNHVYAYVRSFSGLAAEKPPQDNQIMQADAFSYRVLCVNAPMAMDTNALLNSSYARAVAGNLRELRLTFMWPQLPNGNLSPLPTIQTFRASVGGTMLVTNDNGPGYYYFCQPQSFSTNAP